MGTEETLMKMKLLWCVVMIGLILYGWAGKADAEPADSFRMFADALVEHAAVLDDHFSILCTPSLIAELKKTTESETDSIVLNDLQSMVGMTGSCKVIWYDDKVDLSDIQYYAGWRILHMYYNGQAEQLPARERQTLDIALIIVQNASGTDLEKERYIYDALCQRITYESVDSVTGDNDCAIGALVNGRADCDGYADAMMLCCNLAGIPCRYMYGKSLKFPAAGAKDISHMWNLVYINKQWYMTDVTWGDQKTHISYLYFNIGVKDAADFYSWVDEYLFTDVAEKADYSECRMKDQMTVAVKTMEDVYHMARETALSGSNRLILYCSDKPLWDSDLALFELMLQSGGFNEYQYSREGRFCELTNIMLPKEFCFCDSEEDILSAIKRYADHQIPSFSLYLNPFIMSPLFANQCAGLSTILSRSRLQSGCGYQYNADIGEVTFTRVSFTDDLPSCATEDDLVSLIHREVSNHASSVTVLLDDSILVEGIIDKAINAAYSRGVQSISYSISGNRLTLMIESYYADYCFAKTKGETLSYLCTAKNEEKTEVRMFCSDMLYGELMQNNAEEFFSLLEQAGITDCKVFYNDSTNMLMVNEIK